MKVSTLLLPLAAAVTASAFVIPDEHTQNILAQEAKSDTPPSRFSGGVSGRLSTSLTIHPKPCHENTNKNGVKKHHRKGMFIDKANMEAFHGRAWLSSPQYQALDLSPEQILSIASHGTADEDTDHPHHPPHHGNPHHGHREPNETIWQMISSYPHTSKLAKLVGEYPDLVETLNSTKSNFTFFAPTDYAFEKLEKHRGNHSDHKPSKELIKKVLTYHLSEGFYPAGKILQGHTIPSALQEDRLGGLQRLRIGLGFKGLAVNFYARIVAVDIFATNGVIHSVESLILPPPSTAQIISFLPGTFSTFSLAASVTNLTDHLPKDHIGGTLFAPSNNAFQRLGPRLNAFLFSPYGRKYLLALLKYHIVYNETLYSDAYYHPKVDQETTTDIPKGHYHVDLQTQLEGKHLSIDVGRFGGLIDITINGYTKIAVQDGLAADSVIQVPRNVLIPPKKPGEFVVAEGMSVEDFKSRFEGLVENDDVDSEKYEEEEVITMW